MWVVQRNEIVYNFTTMNILLSILTILSAASLVVLGIMTWLFFEEFDLTLYPDETEDDTDYPSVEV